MTKQVINMVAIALIISALPGCLWSNNEQTEQKEQAMAQKVMSLPSGLKYEVLQEAPADAKQAQKGNAVVVHYTGWLEDSNNPGNADQNKKFDSSVDRGMPFQFMLGVGQVIKGWDEGVADMKVGEKRKLIIPSDLGYGAFGSGALIPPNATLIFEVALLDVNA